MGKKKDMDAVRVRLTIPRDADGLVEYLKACDPKILSTTVYQLVYLGFLVKKDRMRAVAEVGPNAVAARSDPPAAVKSGEPKGGSAQVDVASTGSPDADLTSFGQMFGDTYRLAAR